MPEQEGRTKFRKYAATAMASAAIGTVLYRFAVGDVSSIPEGAFLGTLLGLASKYLWDEAGT